MNTADIQRHLTALGHDPGPIDGHYGPRTRAGIHAAIAAHASRAAAGWQGWAQARLLIAAEQTIMHAHGVDAGPIDGLMGPQTRHARTVFASASAPPAPASPPPPASTPASASALVPSAWMPRCAMRRVHLHWTAGAYGANGLDLNSYHLLVDGTPKLVRGRWPISANVNCPRGAYAAHTLSANPGAIGVSICCMGGPGVTMANHGAWPMKREQWEMAVRAVADLCRFYAIPVTDKTVLTHAEVQPNLGIRQNGKWDIAILSFDRSFDTARKVGDRLRREVAALL